MGPFTVPITLVKRSKGAPDARGNDTWTEVGTVTRGMFAPGTSVEQVQGRDSLTVQPTVYLGPGADVTYLDEVIVAGDRYLVDGSPNTWTNPFTGRTVGVEVRLRRAVG